MTDWTHKNQLIAALNVKYSSIVIARQSVATLKCMNK